MKLTFINFYGDTPPEEAESTCVVLNNTVMLCPTPNIRSFFLSRKKRHVSNYHLGINALETIRNSKYLGRQRRQTRQYLNNPQKHQYYLGFKLDGVTAFANLTEALGNEKGIIKIYYDPEIEPWTPKIRTFKPYKGDHFITIEGNQMDFGCSLHDYKVIIGGDGICENDELLSNKFYCKPPVDPPYLGLITQNGNHRVFLQVGGIRLEIGYLDYWTGPLDDPAILAAVVAICVILVVIIIGVSVYLVLWKYLDKNPYMYLRYKISNSPNVYEEDPNAPLQQSYQPQFNVIEELKEKEPGLYENVLNNQIDASRMHLGAKIGKGNFGEVHQGTYKSWDGQKDVAIKTLKSE